MQSMNSAELSIREAEELKRVSNIVSKEIGEAVRRGEDVSMLEKKKCVLRRNGSKNWMI